MTWRRKRDYHLDLLSNRGRMEMGEAGDLPLRLLGFEDRVEFNRFFQFVVRLVRHVVLEHIQDELFFDRLPHGIEMERVRQSICARTPNRSSVTLRGWR